MPEPAPQTPVLWEPLAWIRNDDQNFLISTAIAIAVIVIWGCHRFNVPSFAQKPSHPETMLLPVDLAPPREYLKGISIYVSMLVAGYIAMLVLGPAVLQSLGVPKNVAIESLQSPSSYPILLVLLITGMLPYTWKLSSVESWMRAQASPHFCG
jgi:hypothetical protein